MHLPAGASRPNRIVSGGQTGVDQAALATAIELDIPHGGWCPLGRRSESGTIPLQYQLEEMPTRDYAARTRQNIIDSDGTLIVYSEQLSGGTLLTQQYANELDRPLFLLDLAKPPAPRRRGHGWTATVSRFSTWPARVKPRHEGYSPTR